MAHDATKNLKILLLQQENNIQLKNLLTWFVLELKLKINWRGSGLNTKGVNKFGKVIIECNKKYFRPTEVESLLGNPRKAKNF